MDLWTQTISAPLIINTADAVYRMSITAQGGTVQIQGNFTFKGLPSGPITIQDQSSIILAANPNSAMNLSIVPLGGDAAVIVFFN